MRRSTTIRLVLALLLVSVLSVDAGLGLSGADEAQDERLAGQPRSFRVRSSSSTARVRPTPRGGNPRPHPGRPEGPERAVGTARSASWRPCRRPGRRRRRPDAAVRSEHRVRRAELLLLPGRQSNDPSYLNGSTWGLYGDATNPANPYGSQAGEAWARGFVGSRDIVVAVIDTGIDINHPDLKANIWTNPVHSTVNGVNDDHNCSTSVRVKNDGSGESRSGYQLRCRYVDDVHGWDFVNGDGSVYDSGSSGPRRTDTAPTSPAPSAPSAGTRSASPG